MRIAPKLCPVAYTGENRKWFHLSPAFSSRLHWRVPGLAKKNAPQDFSVRGQWGIEGMIQFYR